MASLRRNSAALPDRPDVPGFDQIGAIDEVEHLLHILLDNQDGEPLTADAADKIEHLLDGERRQTRGGLVH